MRTSNEDAYAANLKCRLFLVADGMGGHAAGEIASQMAASTVEEWVASHIDAEPGTMLRQAALEANERIYEAQRQSRQLAGMGSTLTALMLPGDTHYIAHVGDSRAYRMRGSVLEQLTRDHSLVWHLYENGVLKKEELSRHPQKNLITRSIGSYPQVEVDLEKGEARPGDVYLLCSDGLTDGVDDGGICRILSDPRMTPQEMANGLVNAANQAGGPDNITVIVVRLEAGSREECDTGKQRTL